MTTFYCWDAAGLYVGAKEADEDGPLPERSTPTKPPKLTGSQVARWTGSGWEKLAAAPEAEPAPAPDWPALIAARRYPLKRPAPPSKACPSTPAATARA
jgi:hypothetical protein